MGDEGDEAGGERVSRFREHTNTSSSIRAPPDELWRDLGIEALLQKFDDENDTTPAVRNANHPRRIMEPTGARKSPASTARARKQSDAAATVATAEGTFGRFSRVFANVFGGVLGKRKAGHDATEEHATPADAAQAVLDERKRAAEEAYHLAKAQGLLPAPKVFVRPGMTPRAWSVDSPARPRPRPPLTPRTPGSVARRPSKKDLHKQKKLSKRVSSLEVKLASAKKELQSVLASECFPAVPPLPFNTAAAVGSAPASGPTSGLASSPTPHVFSDDTTPLSPTFGDGASASLPGNITKKRKSGAVHDVEVDIEVDIEIDEVDDLFPAITSDVDMSESEHTQHQHQQSPAPRGIKRLKSDATKRLKRTSSRLTRKVSRSSVRPEQEDQVVIVVKPGGAVPPVPALPSGVEGHKVKVVGDDGYGGLGHEMF